MKKKLIGALMVAGMLVFASGASAALTNTQVNAILGLLNAFGADATTVANVQATLTGKTPILSGKTTTLSGDTGNENGNENKNENKNENENENKFENKTENEHETQTENGDSASTVCCASFGYGAYMVKTPSTYSMVPKNECSSCISDPTTGTTDCLSGGGREIVDDSYCKKPTTNVSPSDSTTPDVTVTNPTQVPNVSPSNKKIGRRIIAPSPIVEIRRACSSPLAGILRNGDRGDRVKYLQAVLSHEGFLKDDEVDGDFGKITKYALRKFQKAHNLLSDGILGSHTGSIVNEKIQEVCSSGAGE